MSAGTIGAVINNLIGIGISIFLIIAAVDPEMVTKKKDILNKLKSYKIYLLIFGSIFLLYNAAMIAMRASVR